jgi:hypothetical protein
LPLKPLKMGKKNHKTPRYYRFWSYFFRIDFDLQVSISVNVLTNNQVTKIFGGRYFLKNNLFVARKLH